MTLTVTDAGSLTDTAVAVISVSDVNENPLFVGAPYSATIAENDAAASVVTVSATDPDLGKVLKTPFSFTLSTPSMAVKRCLLGKAQWQIQGRGPGTLFLDQTEARRAVKICFWRPPPFLSQGLDDRLPTPGYLKVLIRPLKQKFCLISSGTNIPLFCSREFLKAVINDGFSIRARVNYLKFTRVNEIGTMYGRLRVQMSGVQLLYLRATFHTLPLFYIRT